jgi:hypothetical protein
MFFNPVVKRFFIFLVIGLVFGTLLAEIPFMLLPHVTRSPQKVILIIPAGTAQRVASGEQPPSIPQNMIFVVGDTLVVQNEDSVQHQLGPLFIPPGSSASLPLNTAQKYAFQCSFATTKILGLDVTEPLDAGTRLAAILLGGLPMGMLLAVYSLVMWPAKKKESAA